jgi:hypothetical protein
VYTELLPALKKLQEVESSRRDLNPVPRPTDVDEVESEHKPEQCDARCNVDGPHADVKPLAVPSNSNGESTSTASSNAKHLASAFTSSGQSRVHHTLSTGGCVDDFKNFTANVVVSKEEQKTRRHVLLVRGVLDVAVTDSKDLQLAQELLSPCSDIAHVVSAERIGTQRNILRVELDKPLARKIVDFFYANRQLFTSPTMTVAPSRVRFLQLAVQRLHHLQQVLKERLPQLKAQIVEGTGLLLCGTNHFTAYASLAQGLVFMNGDVLPFSHLENSDLPVIIQKKDRPPGVFYQAENHFSQID